MNWFPQLQSGSVTQLPASRRRRWRSITNSLEAGERIALPDHGAGQVVWGLTYSELTAPEVASLASLFSSGRGRLTPFGFVDPFANLLAWSEVLADQSWQTGLLRIGSATTTDPLGTQRAITVTNQSGGIQSISQTVNIPGFYTACFSGFLRGNGPCTVVMQRDGHQVEVNCTSNWKRVFVSGAGSAGAQQAAFSLSVAPGAAVDIWGLQVEAQPYPSAYKVTQGGRGIYEETYFATDQLDIIRSAPGLSACDLELVSRV